MRMFFQTAREAGLPTTYPVQLVIAMQVHVVGKLDLKLVENQLLSALVNCVRCFGLPLDLLLHKQQAHHPYITTI